MKPKSLNFWAIQFFTNIFKKIAQSGHTALIIHSICTSTNLQLVYLSNGQTRSIVFIPFSNLNLLRSSLLNSLFLLLTNSITNVEPLIVRFTLYLSDSLTTDIYLILSVYITLAKPVCAFILYLQPSSRPSVNLPIYVSRFTYFHQNGYLKMLEEVATTSSRYPL